MEEKNKENNKDNYIMPYMDTYIIKEYNNLNQCISNNYKYIVSRDVGFDNKKNFRGFFTLESYKYFLENLINNTSPNLRCYYEITKNNDNIKPYFDFDKFNICSKDEIIKHIEEFIVIFNNYFETQTTIKDFLIYFREKPNKDNLLSLHLVNIKYNTTKENLKNFVNYIQNINDNNILLDTIDNKVYNKNNAFNFPYNTKKKYVDEDYTNIFIDLVEQSKTPEDFLLSYIENTTTLKTINNKIVIKQITNKNEIKNTNNNITLNLKKNMKYIFKDIKQIYTFIIENANNDFYINSKYWKTITNIFIKENLNEQLIYGWCNISSNKSNGKWKTENNLDFIKTFDKDKYKSGIPTLIKILNEYFSNKCTIYIYNFIVEFRNDRFFEKKIIKWISIKTNIQTKDIKKIFNDKIEEECLFFDNYKYDKSKGFLYKIIKNQINNEYIDNFYISTQYNNNINNFHLTTNKKIKKICDTDKYIDAFLSSNNEFVINFKAYWGIGKTHFIIKKIINYTRYGKKKMKQLTINNDNINNINNINTSKILIITENNSLNSKLSEDVNFKSHLDETTQSEKDYYICSLESLSKTNNIKYDIIILDEYVSILKHFDSDTMEKEYKNKEFLFKIFKNKLIETKKIICLDADLTDETLNIIKNIKNKSIFETYEVLENKYKDYNYNILTEYKLYLNEIFNNLKINKKLILPFTVKKELLNIYFKIKNIYPNKKVLVINSDGATLFLDNIEQKIDKNECIKNLEDIIINNHIDIFLFSPSIKTGISINKEYFDKCIIYSSSLSVPVRELIQMFYRARNLIDKDFYIYCTDKQYRYRENTTIEKVKFKILNESLNANNIITNKDYSIYNYTDEQINDSLIKKKYDIDLLNLNCINKYEDTNSKKRYFQNMITTLKYIYGYKINFIFKNEDHDIETETKFKHEDEYLKKFIDTDLISFKESIDIENIINIFELLLKDTEIILKIKINLEYDTLDDTYDSILIKIKSYIFLNEEEDISKKENIFKEYNEENKNNNIEYIKDGLKKLMKNNNYKILFSKNNFFRHTYFFSGISDKLEYDMNIYNEINEYNNIKILSNDNIKKQYLNIKCILDGDIDDIVNKKTGKLKDIKELYVYDEGNKDIIIKLMIYKTIEALNLDYRYEKFMKNKDFNKLVDQLVKTDYFVNLKNFFKNIYDDKEIYFLSSSNPNIYRTMKYAFNEILNYIGINIRYVDSKNKNTTRESDYLVIKMYGFLTERPNDIFIKKELIKKGHGKNVCIDINKTRVYEYNKKYFTYINYKLTEVCKKISDDIDNEYEINKKPRIISYTRYNEIIENLHNKNKTKNITKNTQNNKINVFKYNQMQYKIEELINNDEDKNEVEIIEDDNNIEYFIEE